MSARKVDQILRESLARANELLRQAQNHKGIRAMLQQADRDLKLRLRASAITLGGRELRASEATLLAYSKSIEVVLAYTEKRLLNLTHEQAQRAVSKTVKATARDLSKLETAFTGVTRPLRIREAAQLAGVVDRSFRPLLSQHKTSVQRYGNAMIGEFRKIMRKGIITGASNGEMVDALVKHGGPNGLFQAKRYWARRIVRTEVAHAQNEARLNTIVESQRTDFPDIRKKILATFDNRTAMDSIGVHGQVRAPLELFMDGAGRQYLRPPARPNDRETIVPWRAAWPDTEYSTPVPPETVAQMQAEGEPGGEEHAHAIRVASERNAATNRTEARAARARVEELIGKRIAQTRVQARIADVKAAAAIAQGQQRAAGERARRAIESANREAVTRLQKIVLKDSKREHLRKRAAERALAKAEKYKAKRKRGSVR